MAKKTTEELISELSSLWNSNAELGTDVMVEDALRYIMSTAPIPKGREQKELEKRRRNQFIKIYELKNEIACRLKTWAITNSMTIDDFRNFLLVNFQIEGNKFKRNEKLLMPREITEKMLETAAKEADRRKGRYVAPEKPKRKGRRT